MYELVVGPIPEGMTIDHRCHDRASCSGGPACLHRRCVNPAHLELATQRDNMLRGWAVPRSRRITINVGGVDVQICKNGHWITSANRGPVKRYPNLWHCRLCTLAGNQRAKT